MARSHRSHHSKGDETESEEETSDTDAETDTEGSSDESSDHRSSRRHSRKSHEDHKALIKGHRKHSPRSHHPHGGLPSWVMYSAIACLILGICFGAYYFLIGEGASSSSTGATGSTGSTKAPTASGTAGGTGGAGAGSAGSAAGATTGKSSAAGTVGSSKTAGGTAGGTGATGTKEATAGASPTPAGGGKPASSSGTIHAVFYETWGPIEVSKIPFDKYTHVYWFVATDVKGSSPPTLDFHETESKKKADFISAAHAAGSKALFSVGGWSNSDTFSKTFSSADSRTAYVKMLKGYLDTDKWDGVDIDWEYPGAAGNTQDFDLKNDLPNFLLFFEELRKELGDDVMIAVDTSAKTWVDPATGNPSTSLGDFAKLIDHFLVMTYDAWGSGAVSGPNFPISSDCSPSDSPWNFPDAIQAWIDAGVPAEKLLVGLAAYGHAWTVANFDDTGAAAGAKSPVFQKTEKAQGTINYATILSQGLDKDAKLDDCTASAYVYANGDITIWDNAETTKTKAGISKKLGLGGCGLFAMIESNDLVDAMIEAC